MRRAQQSPAAAKAARRRRRRRHRHHLRSPQRQNPCPPSPASLASIDGSRSNKARQPTRVDPRGTLGDILWRHRAAESRPAPRAAAVPRAAADLGEIAVIQDDGSLVAPPNAFDLQGTGLRFAPRAGDYDVSRIDASFQAAIGDPVSLQDDDSSRGRWHSRSRSTACRSPRRSSIPTATSPSARRTAPAPREVSADCCRAPRASARSSPISIPRPAVPSTCDPRRMRSP